MIPHAIHAAGAFLGRRWLVVLRILAVVGYRVEVAAVRWVLTVGVVGPGSLADTHDTGTIEAWGLVGAHSV